jgi:radical SAM superfamily enzyme YgiQ (UPF0313 family)
MYKNSGFRIRKLDEILEDIEVAGQFYGDTVKTIFFPDGNTICRKTNDLVVIFSFAKRTFKKLERITIYGSSKFIKLKSLEELKMLRDSGLSRIHCGMESGDNVVLKAIHKGATSRDHIIAGTLVRKAGIELSEYFLVGIAGREHSRDHAIESARVLSKINPEFIRLRTFVPVFDTPLFDQYRFGTLELLSPHEALNEVKTLIENLDATSMILSDHISNYANVHGRLPQDREEMLVSIKHAMTLDREHFRPEVIIGL